MLIRINKNRKTNKIKIDQEHNQHLQRIPIKQVNQRFHNLIMRIKNKYKTSNQKMVIH